MFDPPRAAPDFALRGSDGARADAQRAIAARSCCWRSASPTAPTVCPTTLATLAQARKQLGARPSDVQVVYVTVDPERDDAARLKNYLAAFDPTFVGGTGTPDALAAVRKSYGVTADKQGTRRRLRDGPLVVHLPDRSRAAGCAR